MPDPKNLPENQNPFGDTLIRRREFSIIFKAYCHVISWLDKTDTEEKVRIEKASKFEATSCDFYHHTMRDNGKLKEVVASIDLGQWGIGWTMEENEEAGNNNTRPLPVTLSIKIEHLIGMVNAYVNHVATMRPVKPHPRDKIHESRMQKEQIRLYSFTKQKIYFSDLLEAINNRYKEDGPEFLLRELDIKEVVEIPQRDHEQCAQEELVIWFYLHKRLYIKGMELGKYTSTADGSEYYFWVLNITLAKSFSFGQFTIDFENDTIHHGRYSKKYYKQDGSPFAWGVIFRLLIEFEGSPVKAVQMEAELIRKCGTRIKENTISKLISDLKKRFHIPTRHCPNASGQGEDKEYRLVSD